MLLAQHIGCITIYCNDRKCDILSPDINRCINLYFNYLSFYDMALFGTCKTVI